MAIFLLLIAAIMRNSSFTDIYQTAKSANKYYLLLGALVVFIFIYFEGVSFFEIMKYFKYKVSKLKCLKYAMAGYFYSAITPSSSGGQPMQFYYMSKDKIEASHATLSLLVIGGTFQFVCVLLSIFGLIYSKNILTEVNSVVYYLIFIGIFLNSLFVVMVLAILIFPKISRKIVVTFFNLVDKFNFKKLSAKREAAYLQLDKYRQGAKLIKNNKWLVIKVTFNNLIRLIALQSVPYIVYRALGYQDVSFITLFSLQAILYVATGFIPIPGAMGVSETAFISIFSIFFAHSTINSAMLLSRGISFYLYIIVSGIFLIFLKKKNKAKDLKKEI